MIDMMVCPHDTAHNPERWFMVSQYLSSHAGVSVRLDLSLDFTDFHDKFMESGFIYANPNDSLRLMAEGYLPLARPDGLFDEVVFIASAKQVSPAFESLRGATVASVASMFPSNLALTLLDDAKIAPVKVEDCGSWMSVVRNVAQEKFAYGFVYKDFFDQLSGYSRGNVNAFYHSDEKAAFHMLLLNPGFKEYREAIQGALLSMQNDKYGAEILEGLNIKHWIAVDDASVGRMREIHRLVA
jgi:hypothetical protein